jgi:hypothetical protein
MWSRVFGTNDVPPEPAALLEHLHGVGLPVHGRFRGDDQGWFDAQLVFDEDSPPLQVERYLATEEGIRADLNSWAAWLETAEDNPHSAELMQHVISTTQLFTLHCPEEEDDEGAIEPLRTALCRFLAGATGGVYQVDGQGFFAADGSLLVRED